MLSCAERPSCLGLLKLAEMKRHRSEMGSTTADDMVTAASLEIDAESKPSLTSVFEEILACAEGLKDPPESCLGLLKLAETIRQRRDTGSTDYLMI